MSNECDLERHPSSADTDALGMICKLFQIHGWDTSLLIEQGFTTKAYMTAIGERSASFNIRGQANRLYAWAVYYSEGLNVLGGLPVSVPSDCVTWTQALATELVSIDYRVNQTFARRLFLQQIDDAGG